MTGYWKVTANAVSTCVKCPANAAECSSTTVATVCNTGFVLVGSSCV